MYMEYMQAGTTSLSILILTGHTGLVETGNKDETFSGDSRVASLSSRSDLHHPLPNTAVQARAGHAAPWLCSA
ncbi:hypothetical protein CMQ_1135 [Grosmannia clavigera kw1407]|uniref:Uncharacterized protein n=1 Tax=Grosmannia clavigera (strain kw1407 / UAMH 11150) TaxID=655863 RepID=F0XEP5_GROCL|nr:uncharacterized protein CMQ_1135 [Grosmannia clavigera kw1407]EFX04207.1 hypothetical protein CMQ_1135 [Grosmannia clavigera kw1407]